MEIRIEQTFDHPYFHEDLHIKTKIKTSTINSMYLTFLSIKQKRFYGVITLKRKNSIIINTSQHNISY